MCIRDRPNQPEYRRPWLNANPLTVDQALETVVGLPDGVDLVIVMYDGSLRTIDNSVDKQVLRFLFEPADGNEIPEFSTSFKVD